MDRGSNLNILDFWRGKLSYYAVCNNNPQCIERWVVLPKTVNHQGPSYMTQFSMTVVIEGVHLLFYLIFSFKTFIYFLIY